MPAPHALYSKMLAERTASRNVLVLLYLLFISSQKTPEKGKISLVWAFTCSKKPLRTRCVGFYPQPILSRWSIVWKDIGKPHNRIRGSKLTKPLALNADPYVDPPTPSTMNPRP